MLLLMAYYYIIQDEFNFTIFVFKVAFKLNTVVNVLNKDEDMSTYIKELSPCRWKVT